MSIERITPEEFDAATRFSRSAAGRSRSPETRAVLVLQPGEAVKFPCRWKHYRRGTGKRLCSSVSTLHGSMRRHGKVSVRCVEGVVYVKRLT